MSLRSLPNGWSTSTIGDISLVNPRSFVQPVEDDWEVSFIPMAAVEARTGHIELDQVRKYEEVRKGYTRFSEGDVLFAKITPCMENGKIAIAKGLNNNSGCGSTEFHVMRPQHSIACEYLMYYLLQEDFRKDAQRNMSGTAGQLRVPAAWLIEALLPLPPLPEQHRIVAEIEKHFTRLDASVAALKRAQANLKRYRASVLKSACEGTLVLTEAELARAEGRDYEPADFLLQRILAERRARWESQEKKGGEYKEPTAADTSELPELPDGWGWATVEQVIVESPQNGLYKPKTEYGDGVPILRIDDFQDFFLKDREQLRLLSVTDEEIDLYGLKESQLIVNRVNSLSHLGKCLVVPESLLPAVFESNMMKMTTHDSVDPSFVAYYLRSREGKTRLTANAKWAVNQASINQKDVCATPLPLPPRPEQHRIVAEVERRLSVIQQSEVVVGASLVRAERLRQSILKQAFSGQLVPQDPTDEPASVLLEHIKAEREAAREAEAAKPRPRRPRAASSKRSKALKER